MNILYVASEASPFAASGGLGDVMGALPKTLKRLAGKETGVGVVMPLYSSIPETYRQKMRLLDEFEFMYGWRHAYCGVFTLRMDGVDYYFIDNEQYFMRHSLYGQYDDGERFAYFCRAVVEMMLRMDTVFDVLHANDWQSALAVVYLKTRFSDCAKFRGIKTVFTIHNIEYQGKFDEYILGNIFDLDTKYLSILEYDHCINLMKGAIVCCDRLTTVSPTYACEIKEPYFAYGLSDIIRENDYKLSGIINGIDTKVFSPAEDNDIAFPFLLSQRAEGKRENKLALQKEIGLAENPDVPLVAMVTRLTHGKGIDLVLRIFDEMMTSDIQFVLLGTGDSNYERIFSDLCARYPDRAKALIRFDRALSKRIYAAASMFLMPSKSEPCGLAQMIACSYGTIPVVRSVGGLADTIIPYGQENANGFRFNNFNAHELLFTVKDALEVYRDGEEWDRLVRQAMKTDFSWSTSAKEYLATYQRMVSPK